MVGTKALALAIAEDYPAAASWAERAARAPYSHYMVGLIAVALHGLNGNDPMASYWAKNVLARRPDVTAGGFLRSFPFVNAATRATFEAELNRFGIPS
jgi:hypothetical protein